MTSEQSPTDGETPSDHTKNKPELPVEKVLDSAALPDIEPLTLPMLGRLFGVPLVIISIIIAGAFVVVMLFGAPSAPAQRSIDDLLTALSSSVGERQMGMLLPHAKEHWQAGLELSLRLESGEVSDEKLTEVAERLAKALDESFPHVVDLPENEEELEPAQRSERRSVEYLIRALGKTKRSQAIEPLLKVMQAGREPFLTVAIQQFGDLRVVPQSQSAIDPIVLILRSGARPEALISACTVLSLLSSPDNAEVIDELVDVYHRFDGDVSWSAALALARLGSDKGKSSLMDLLDRDFWEADDRLVITDKSGNVHRYPMPSDRIETYLVATMEAVSNLSDLDLWEMVDKLKSDPSPKVSQHAAAMLASRKTTK